MKEDLLKKSEFRKYSIILYLVSSFILMFFIEAISRNSIAETLSFVSNHMALYIFSSIIYMSIMIILWLIIRNEIKSFTVMSILTFIFSILSFSKLSMYSQPIFLSNIFDISFYIDTFSHLAINVNMLAFLFVITIIYFTFWFIQIKVNSTTVYISDDFEHTAWKIQVGIIVFIVLVAFNILIFVQPWFIQKFVPNNLGGTFNNYFYYDNFNKNGVVFNIIYSSNIKGNSSKQYETKVDVVGVAKEIESTFSDAPNKNTNSPDIVLLTIDNLLDVSTIKGLTYSKDPLTNYLKILKTSTIGDVVLDNQGNNDDYYMYQILTGLSGKVKNGTPAIGHLGIISLPSVANIAKDNGASTYYIAKNNLSKAKKLGITNFVDTDKITDRQIIGKNVSTSTVAEQIISILSDTQDTNPKLILANSTELNNYENSKYDDNINVSVNFDDKDNKELNSNLSKYYDALSSVDKAIGSIYDYISTSTRPTILVICGNSLPKFDSDYSFYKNSGYIYDLGDTDISDISKVKLNSSPFILFNNTNKINKNIGYIDSSLVGTYLYTNYMANCNMPYFNFLSGVYSKSAYNKPYSDAKDITVLDNVRLLLQKDLFIGSYYSKEYIAFNK